MRAWHGRKLPVLLVAFAEGRAVAQPLPPWVPEGRLELPEDARTAEILARDEPLFAEPNPAAPRRGAALQGARLPIFAAEPGPGCRGDFLLVGANAWICSERVRVTPEPPSAPAPGPTEDGLPYDYFFVGADGTLGYRSRGAVDVEAPVAELQPGFAVAVRTQAPFGGARPEVGQTAKGLWLPLRDLRPVAAPGFTGYEVGAAGLDRGFMVTDRPELRSAPGGPSLPPSRAGNDDAKSGPSKFRTVRIVERATDANGKGWLRLESGAWASSEDVRVPRPAAPPPEVRPGERYIDVDRETQTVVLYEGEKPVFAALASTGIGRGADVTVTPAGVHRIWVKLRSTDMTNLEDEDARRYYAIEEVPWVLFFEKGYGLHGAFWHRSFGHVRSHGCVNLTPSDARRIFDWAGPKLPPGWSAALPTEYDPGTVVRVR